MKSSGFLFLLILISSFRLQAQCPVPSATIPDSVCVGAELNIVNNSTGANPLLYNWDFNAGDLDIAPTGAFIDTFDTEIKNSLGMDLAFQNDSIYGIAIKSSGVLSRFDFGTDISNYPVSTVLPNLNLPGGGNDLVLENINGNWYGFTANFSSLVHRFDFGNSITNVPTTQQITTGASLSGPYYIDFVNDNGRYYLLAANINNNTISILDFGTDITNVNPVITNYTMPGSSAISIAAANDCGNWYVFVGYVGSSTLTRLDFGSSLSNALQNTVAAISATGNIAVRKIQILRDNGRWYIPVISVPGDEMKMYDFGPSLNNTSPSITGLGGFGTVAYGNQTFAIKKHKSEYQGLSPNYVDGRLSWFKFKNPNPGPSFTSTASQPTIQFTAPGSYKIELLVTDSVTGLTAATTDNVIVLPAALPSFTSDIACKDQEVKFYNTSQTDTLTVTNISWDFGDLTTGTGDTVSHIYTASGNYTVQLQIQVSNGCVTTADTIINAHELPVADYSVTDYACAGTPVNFMDASTSNDGIINGYEWYSDTVLISQNSAFSYTYNTGRTYSTRLVITTEFGCTDTSLKNVNVLYRPESKFSPTQTCIGETVLLTNESSIDTTTTLTYFWMTGDGNTTTNVNPTVNYPSVDSTYQVTLISYATNGCSDTLNSPLSVKPPAIAYFKNTGTLFCSGSAIQFTDSSYTQTTDTIIARYWSFGDASYDSTSINPVHIYQSPGTYTITLTVLVATHCSSEYISQVTVLGSPDAGFTYQNVCEGLITHFQDTSTSGPVISWDWDFGDNTTAGGASPDHLYSDAGIYQVMLEVSNQAGCTDTQSAYVNVYDLPVANFTTGLSCTGTPVQFTDSSTVNAGQISEWDWNFGDSSTDTLQNPAHHYTSSQLYTVQLIVSSSYGCSDTVSKFILVKPSPEFNPVSNNVCFGTPATFQSVPGPGQNSTYDYYWNFGDNSFSFQQNPTHNYSSTGVYPVILTIRDLSTNCLAIKNDTLEVYHLPDASFHADSICAGGVIEYINTSNSVSGNIVLNSWNFGAYGNSQDVNPMLNINTAGPVSTQLTVTSAYGCKDSVGMQIMVHPIPVSNFTSSSPFGTPPFDITFTNNSTAGSSALWDFGDNTPTSTDFNPLHTYTDTGTFVVTLLTTSDKGCTATSTDSIFVLYPYLDMGLENISFTKQNGAWKISCRLRNTGNIVVSEFRLSARLQGKSPIIENPTGLNLLPGAIYNYTFNAEFLADENTDPGFLCVNIESVNSVPDQSQSNNQLCTGSSQSFKIIAMYPVPAGDFLQLGLGIPEAGTISYELYDATGKSVIQNDPAPVPEGYNQHTLDLTGLQSGLYILRITYNGKTIIEKFTRT